MSAGSTAFASRRALSVCWSLAGVFVVVASVLLAGAAPARGLDTEEYPGWTGSAVTGITGTVQVKLGTISLPPYANAQVYVRFTEDVKPSGAFGNYAVWWKCGTLLSDASAGRATTRQVIVFRGVDTQSTLTRSCSAYIWGDSDLNVYDATLTVYWRGGTSYPIVDPSPVPSQDPNMTPDPSSTPAPSASVNPSASPQLCTVPMPDGYLGPPAPTACPTPSPSPTASPSDPYSCTYGKSGPSGGNQSVYPAGIGCVIKGGERWRVQGHNSTPGGNYWRLYLADHEGWQQAGIAGGPAGFARCVEHGTNTAAQGPAMDALSTYDRDCYVDGIANGVRAYPGYFWWWDFAGDASWTLTRLQGVPGETPAPTPSASASADPNVPYGNGQDGGPAPSGAPIRYVPGSGSGMGGDSEGPCVPGPLTGECKPGSAYGVMPACPDPWPSLNPLDYFAWIGCLLSGIPTAIGNGLTWLLNGLVDLLRPADVGPFSQAPGAFMTMVGGKAPFGYLGQVQSALSPEYWAGPAPGLTFQIAGTTVNAGTPLTAAVGAVAPFRGVLVAFFWILTALAVLRVLRGAVGGGDSGGAG